MIRVVRDIVRVLGMACRDHTVLLTRQVEGGLSRGEAIGLRIHVVYCRGCRRFRQQVQLLHELSRAMGREERLAANERGMPREVRGRLRREMERSRES